MTRADQALAAVALGVLGAYALLYGDVVRTRWTMPLCVGLFWFELALSVLISLRVQRAPLLIVALVFALLASLAPSALTVLSWSDWLLKSHVPWY
jgi:hypothetical protein